MDIFFTALNAVLPICIIVGLGIFLRHINIMNDGACKILNNLSFNVFLPCMIFSNIYGANVEKSTYSKLLGFAGISLITSFILLMFIISKLEKEADKQGVIVQGCVHNSFLIIGMSLAYNLYPKIDYTVMAILATLAIPINHIASIISLRFFQNETNNINGVFIQIVKNPILISCVLAMLMNAVKLPMPRVIISTVSSLSMPAIPICLLALGGSFKLSSLHIDFKQVLFSCGVKLIFLPIVFVSIGVLYGFKGLPLLALLVFFGSPTAPVTYTLTASMGGDTDLASKIILFSNGFSAITLFFFIYVLMSLGVL